MKEYIRNLAALGMNALMLYTEDTYEIKEYPYFGAFRGRYSESELRECDDYADLFGIEMIPCIQTLAHLHTPLRWNEFSKLKDTQDILLVGEEEVYHFIECMIQSASAPFRSRRIHLGMDEAHELGLGKYLDQNGFQDKFTIMNAHLNRVIALCRKNDLEPMIWSDMYFRIKSSTGDYYDVPETMNFSESERPSEELGIIYWDYYHEEEEYYKSYLDLHKKLSKKVSFAGGGWTWNGVAPNYSKMKATTNAALAACKEKKVKEVFCTLWQDNGAETPMKTAFVGITLFAEHSFHETVSENALKERFEALWKESYETYQLLDQFDHTKGTLPN
ncbi:MAG: beta-N-acetylhexosaminidase, partial [Acetivibrio sp.]